MTAARQFDDAPRPAGESRGAVARAVEAMRALIRDRQLLPGEPIRQHDMAERLGMSRVPVREALKALQMEGIVRHSPNQGYFVAKSSAVELDQIYLMRRLLETALLRRVQWPDAKRLEGIAAINRELAAAAQAGDVVLVVQCNRRFHEAIYALSPLDAVHREIKRLWEMSESYRALYLYSRAARERIVAEHQSMLDALARRDLDGLLEALDHHRWQAQDEVAATLGGPRLDDLGAAP